MTVHDRFLVADPELHVGPDNRIEVNVPPYEEKLGIFLAPRRSAGGPQPRGR